jgi:hypothetical protein
MEQEPDTENVVYMDEARKARWLRQLDDARNIGGVATFNFEYTDPAKVIPFPRKDDDPTPDGAA